MTRAVPALLAFALAAVLLMGCGKQPPQDHRLNPDGGAPGEPMGRVRAEPAPTHDLRVGESVKLGPVTLTFRIADIRNHQVLSDGQWVFLGGTQLGVVLDIKHDDPAKIIDVSPLSEGAVATDELGNKYQQALSPGESCWVSIPFGQVLVGTKKRLRSDEPAGDVILFERPVPAAKTIYVTLNASKFGQKGSVRLVMNQTELSPKTKTPYWL